MLSLLPRTVRAYRALASNYDDAMGFSFFCRTRALFEKLQDQYGFGFRSAADLGCGTGLFALYLATAWQVPVFAVDQSAEMLCQASKRCQGLPVHLLKQDLRQLSLPCPVDLMTANYDVLNHITRPEELQATLKCIIQNLRPGGHFYFDVITPTVALPARRWIRCQRAAVRQFIRWDPALRLLRIDVHTRSGPCSRLEKHCERAYTPHELAAWLRSAGFLIRGIHDEHTGALATRPSPRLVFLCQNPP